MVNWALLNQRNFDRSTISPSHWMMVFMLKKKKSPNHFLTLKIFPHFRLFAKHREHHFCTSGWHFNFSFFSVYMCSRCYEREYIRSHFFFAYIVSIWVCTLLQSIWEYIWMVTLIPLGSIHKTQNVCMYTRKMREKKEREKKNIQPTNERTNERIIHPKPPLFFPD